MEQNETRTLWISLLSAGFAVILLYGWAQDKRASVARKFGQTKTVVVAREDIMESSIIDAQKLEVVEKPSQFIQPSAIQDPTEVIGQIALAPIKKGEQILNTKLVFPDQSTGISMQISPGKRAVTLPANEMNSVGKLIKPGDRVDIIAGVDDGEGTNKIRKVRMLLQDVPILAAGKSIVDNLPLKIIKGDEDNFEIRNLRVDNNYNSLTVEVSPSEALNLYYLSSISAPIYFSLRNPNDRYKRQLKINTVDDVLNRKRREPAKAVKPKMDAKKNSKMPKPVAPKPVPQKGRRFENL